MVESLGGCLAVFVEALLGLFGGELGELSELGAGYGACGVGLLFGRFPLGHGCGAGVDDEAEFVFSHPEQSAELFDVVPSDWSRLALWSFRSLFLGRLLFRGFFFFWGNANRGGSWIEFVERIGFEFDAEDP